ncbi:RNA-binding S4 domain-containing protein [Desulforamulus ruminis]|nr:RNA-binding S4 domain-containing protein [Desulforamulus ruminis]
MQKIKVNTEEIRLDQFLKWANVSGSGGESKVLIQSGMVKVNGLLEMKRGRLLKSGYTVEVEGVGSFLVVM